MKLRVLLLLLWATASVPAAPATPAHMVHSSTVLMAMARGRIHEQNMGEIQFRNTDRFPQVLRELNEETVVFVVMVRDGKISSV